MHQFLLANNSIWNAHIVILQALCLNGLFCMRHSHWLTDPKWHYVQQLKIICFIKCYRYTLLIVIITLDDLHAMRLFIELFAYIFCDNAFLSSASFTFCLRHEGVLTEWHSINFIIYFAFSIFYRLFLNQFYYTINLLKTKIEFQLKYFHFTYFRIQSMNRSNTSCYKYQKNCIFFNFSLKSHTL